jgi:hypothetical protein
LFPCQPDPLHEPLREPLNDALWKLFPWNAPLLDVLRVPLDVPRKLLFTLELRPPLNELPEDDPP